MIIDLRADWKYIIYLNIENVYNYSLSFDFLMYSSLYIYF
jgi:hypothetical protein